jgi:hypothetical protein
MNARTATTTRPGPSVLQPAIERPTSMRLAEREYQRVTDVVDPLRPEACGPPIARSGTCASRSHTLSARQNSSRRPWRWRARRASGSRSDGTSGEEIVMDAAGFCRLVSGRPGPDGGQLWWLLATQIPF